MNVLVVKVDPITSDSTATLGSSSGSHNIEQNTQHKSKCSGVGASCSNSASSTAIIGDGGTTTNPSNNGDSEDSDN